jgi:hypothetical protein
VCAVHRICKIGRRLAGRAAAIYKLQQSDKAANSLYASACIRRQISETQFEENKSLFSLIDARISYRRRIPAVTMGIFQLALKTRQGGLVPTGITFDFHIIFII